MVTLSIQITLALVALGFSLIFVSERLADTASRIIEAAFDAVEYQLALQAERRAAHARDALNTRRVSSQVRYNF